MGGGGTTVSPEFTGGASSGGNQKNEWGDNIGSDMTMVSGGGIATAVAGGLLGLAAIAGVTVWLVKKTA